MRNHARPEPASDITAVWRIRDVAAFWQRTPTTVMRWVESGRHPGPRLDPGGQRYWLAADVQAFARSGSATHAEVTVAHPTRVEEIPPLELVIGDGGAP